jgi:glutamate-5-semialdehyde dehydrogenase
MNNVETNLEQIAKNAKMASYKLASLSTEIKNQALLAIAENIKNNKEIILKQNNQDLINAKILLEKGSISQAVYDRLKLDDEKINVMIQGIKDVASLEDPVNKTLWAIELEQGLELFRVSCPIGVIGVIFESRPDVTPQIASLAVKSSNSIILKGGSEAAFSNEILTKLINEALDKIKLFPKNTVNLIKTREDVAKMLNLAEYIDLIIPRGGNQLVKYIQANTKIPVLGHADGICHIYVDKFADLNKATKIIIDSKIQYPSACNAVETVLIHQDLTDNYLPKLIKKLQDVDVKIKIEPTYINIYKNIEAATEEDWQTEYSEKIVSIKVVEDVQEAICHINKYGSGHTDCIITENKENTELFMNLVDSAGVYKNASTRFADGFRYGLGAEVGISTNKTHARGPVGLEGLVIYKYKLFGSGQTVGEFSGENARKFIHKQMY